MVTVTATDSAGEASDPIVTVTITVTDVNEKPTFGDGIARRDAGRPIRRHDRHRLRTCPRVDVDSLAPFTATDPEGANVELTLSGDDKDMFELLESRLG